MFIDPVVKSLIIFNGGGGIVEREMKLTLQQGRNEFQIQNVPASFNPNSADIRLEYVNPEDKDDITLQQTIVSLPDKSNVDQVINREKSSANSIISYAIDFTREMRQTVSSICEASSYRTYADMIVQSEPTPSEIEQPNYKYKIVISSEEKSSVLLELQAKIVIGLQKLNLNILKRKESEIFLFLFFQLVYKGRINR